ncbi:MAG: hypothetical protein VCF07_15580, partial [Nitrospinota bacterium]
MRRFGGSANRAPPFDPGLSSSAAAQDFLIYFLFEENGSPPTKTPWPSWLGGFCSVQADEESLRFHLLLFLWAAESFVAPTAVFADVFHGFGDH